MKQLLGFINQPLILFYKLKETNYGYQSIKGGYRMLV